MVLCVKGRQQRGLTLPLQIETKPQKRKTRFASNSVESIPARGWPQIYEWFHSMHVSPTCRADGYTDSMKLARLKNLSRRASGKDQTCGLIFLSVEGSVYGSAYEYTHTPPPLLSTLFSTLPPSDPEIIHQCVYLRKTWSTNSRTSRRQSSDRLILPKTQTFIGQVLLGGKVTFSMYKHGADQTCVFLFLYISTLPLEIWAGSCFSLIEFVPYWRSP